MSKFTTARAPGCTHNSEGWMTMKGSEPFCYSQDKADADAITHALNIDSGSLEARFFDLSAEELASALAFAAVIPSE